MKTGILINFKRLIVYVMVGLKKIKNFNANLMSTSLHILNLTLKGETNYNNFIFF